MSIQQVTFNSHSHLHNKLKTLILLHEKQALQAQSINHIRLAISPSSWSFLSMRFKYQSITAYQQNSMQRLLKLNNLMSWVNMQTILNQRCFLR